MEYKFCFSRRWIQKMVVFIGFSLFTARAQAQIILAPAPSITLQPIGLSVLNGGTAVLIADASASALAPISSVTWYHNGQAVSKSQVLTINAGLTAVSTLTIPNVSSSNGGTYYMVAKNSTGSTPSSNADVIVVLNTVSTVLNAVTGASKMLTSGFKLEFNAPTGSNVVIEATSDMNNWSALCTNVATGGNVTYTDAVAKTYSCRFYRARIK
jgi:hypothetical protein